MLTDQIMKEHGLNQQESLQAVGLSRSTYHYQSQPGRTPGLFDHGLCAAIREVNRKAPVYGYRKVTAALQILGWLVNHKRVLRYMRYLKLLQPRNIKGRQWTRLATVRPVASNTYWEMDLSYVWCGDRQGYLFAVLDCFDKTIPGESLGDRCRAREASEVLEQAVLSRFQGRVPEGHRLVLRVDRGSQFTARLFRETALRLGITLEYAGVQCPNDKPYIESFFGKYKTEEVYRKEYRNITEARIGWELYRVWHETERIHQSLDYQTPRQVREQSQKMALANEEKNV